MDYKDKEDIQLDSLNRLMDALNPRLDKAQDDEFEAKGWQKGFEEFIKLIGQISFRSGQKQGHKEGLEIFMKSLQNEIAMQKERYKKLREAQAEGSGSDVHPDDRVKDINKRRKEAKIEKKQSKKK